MAAVSSIVRPAEGSLETLRRSIDSVDESLHDLLMRRAVLSVEVAEAKARDGGTGAPVFRPAREAEILRRLVARNRGPLPPELIVRLWREIMVTSARLQGPLTVAVAAGRAAATAACPALARAHFGTAGLRPVASPAAAIAAVAKGRAQLGVLPLPGGRGAAGGWWTRLPASVQILARLPILRTPNGRRAPDAVVIGRQAFEPSSDDVFYVAVTSTKRAGRRAMVPSARVIATARRAGRAVTLLETDMPFDDLSTRLGAAATVEFLGGYARPIQLARRNSKAGR